MIASMKEEFENALEDAEADETLCREISVATGKAAYPFFCELTEKFREKYPNVKIHVYEIENRFFGESVTVAGLLTGRDISEQLYGKQFGDVLLFPENALRSGGDVFLDDMTPEELSQKLGTHALPAHNDGAQFIRDVLGV